MSSAPADFPLKPLGIGELLDRALRIARAKFWELFKVAFAFQAVLHAISKASEILAFRKLGTFLSMNTARGAIPPSDQIAWALGIGIVSLAVAIVGFQAAGGAVSAAASDAASLQSYDAIRCWRRLRPRLLPLLATLTLELFFIGAWTSLGVAPIAMGLFAATSDASMATLFLFGIGALLSFVLVPALFLTTVLRYLLVAPVVVVEGLSGLAAIRRSVELMRAASADRFFRGPKVRASLVLLVVGLVMNSVILVSDAPRSMMLLLNGGHAPSIVLLSLAEIVAVIAKTAVLPFGALSIALFYLDIRVRREGLDLELAAERMSKAA